MAEAAREKVSDDTKRCSTSEDGKNATLGAKGSGQNGYLRVFKYGSTVDYIVESIGVIAAIGSGVALAMVNLVMGNFINLLSDFTIGQGQIPAKFVDKAAKYSLYFVYIGIARLVLTYVYASLLTYVALRLTRNLRHSYLRAALSQEVSYFDQGTSGSIAMQATSNGKLIQSGIAEKLGQVFQALSTFVAAFVIAFKTQWKLTLILICILPALLIIVTGVAFLDAKIETKILRAYGKAGAFAEAALGSVRTSHAFNLGPRMISRYDKHLQDARALGDKKSPLYGIMFGGEYFVLFAGMGLAFWQGIGMIARREVDNVGTVFTVLFSVIIAAGTINSVAPHFVTFSRASTAAAELFSLIDRESDIDPFDDSGQRPTALAGDISLSGISFSYPTRPNIRVLEDFHLAVPAGKVTALVGSSGSGKSTIIGLLERWYRPTSGIIKLDGTNIEDLNIKWLRTNIRLVQQEPVLFNGTVFENIANGLVGTPWEDSSPEEQRERVKAVAKVAFAHEFIEELPRGYDTRIGERGGLLSGGQKQRIAIARSIISEPKVLLLDEATSALDPNSEAIVQRALDEASKSRTTIVIAHKLKTIRNADNIVVMGKGTILEQGTHEELVAQGGTYSTLVKAQDLSTHAASKDADSSDDDNALSKEHQSLAVTRTEDGAMLSLKDREDFGLAPRTGIVRTVLRLIANTPELRMWYGISLIMCIIGAAMYPGQTLLLGNVMNVFTSPNMQKRGNFISLMFLVMAIALLFIFFLLGWTTNVISQALAQRVRRDMLSAMLRQDLRFFDRPENTVGALISRIDSHAQAIFELMGFSIALIVIFIVMIIACGVLSIATSWKLGLVGVCAGIPPMVLAGYIRIRTETKMDHDIDSRFSNSASVASESVNAIRTVSSLAIENTVLQRYTAELDHAISGSRPSLFTMMVFFAFTQSVEYFVLGLGFWWGSKLLSQGEISFYQLIVSFMAVYFSGQGAGQMFSFAGSFTKAASAANYYFWLCDLVPTIRETENNRERSAANGCQSYEFSDVAFAYPLAPSNRVLKGISLKIQPGTFVAFVGASGCGKSTMISLLERFYDPSSGRIVIDGIDQLTSLNPKLYRRRIALVQQEPVLFPVSIRENIAMGIDTESVDDTPASRGVSDDMIEAACRAANAWDFVSSLPEGLNTPCGTSGSQLSGGQRQRIAIARALVRNPSVILLDEATSALDTESERIVQAALMEAASTGDRITIAVAHRLSTVRYADTIFVFYGGRIAEAGSHDELIKQGGMYKKMCEAQSLDAAG
ncbi:multidrug resistance protein 3 [Purpureocillium lavendulum]|uniref:Multidrug resistance protein 3 n=1 Tax=Purpureocillium lavendulum TaxID=1247861 RepID=A0AB34FTX6_9HYPO|nr:multidrug resistance protein 3 [Purpureocillium lavendulum]